MVCICRSYKRLEDAKAHVNRLKQIGYDARITSPIVGTEHYGVVIGSY